MHLRLTVASPGTAESAADVAVDADPGTTLGEVRADLLAAARLGAGLPLHVDGTVLADCAVVGLPPLVTGALLTAGRRGGSPGRLAGTAQGLLELHVTGGPDAGAIHPLTPGWHRVGRSADAEVRLDDVDVSRAHAVLDVGPAGVTVTDCGSTNGTTVGDERVGDAGAPLAVGAVLRVGSSSLVLRLPTREAAAVHPTGEGTVEVNRPPRLVSEHPATCVRLPRAPEAPPRRPFPLLAAFLPLVVAVPMAVLWSPFALLLGLTTPVMVLGNVISDRRTGRRSHAEAMARHAAATDEAGARVAALLCAERLHRQLLAPDLATLATAATTPTARLWERRPSDADHLLLRLGTGTVRSAVRVTRPDGPEGEVTEHPDLSDAPVCVPLATTGVLGVSGPRERLLGLARSFVVQLATLHAPGDVRLAVVAAEPEAADWAWSRWLPHVAPGDVAADQPRPPGDAAAARVAGLVGELESRRREA
ncbi:MAG: FHA domain-containing protein, partial [Actinomycetota bacterium]